MIGKVETGFSEKIMPHQNLRAAIDSILIDCALIAQTRHFYDERRDLRQSPRHETRDGCRQSLRRRVDEGDISEFRPGNLRLECGDRLFLEFAGRSIVQDGACRG